LEAFWPFPAAAQEPLAGLWEGKVSAMQPPAALTGTGFFTPATLELLFKGKSMIPPGNQTAVGIGWRVGKDASGRRVVHHVGASQGGRAMLLMYPESGIVVAMLSNILAPFGEQDAQKIGSLFMPAR
jgi:CubicO group peptidase (beta-lactamase class C family)